MKYERPSRSSLAHESLAESGKRLQFCVERGRLLDSLSRASVDYVKAVYAFADRSKTLSPADYVRLRVTVEQARAEAEQCREALHQHQREHGC